MAQKLILLDIDGTLANVKGFVPVSAITACREARKQGHVIYLCTGRSSWQISGEVLALGFDGVISSGGAYIKTGDTTGNAPRRKVILDEAISAEAVKQIAAYLDGRQCGFSLETKDKVISSSRFISHWESVFDRLTAEGNTEKLAFPFIKLINELKENLLPQNLGSCNSDVYEGIRKIIFIGDDNTSFAVVKKTFGQICEIFHGPVPPCDKEDGEIGPLGIHKGSALIKTAEYHGIPLADTIAFGDSDNDCKMIECAGIGVAMGNAYGELKKIADYTTDPPDEDGIFNGFKKFGLLG